ncbi:MAG: hypothetical protein HY581_00540 [Nitrospirae bacterium]|nr:hypothetical protein [Nitrospirota bacterium]
MNRVCLARCATLLLAFLTMTAGPASPSSLETGDFETVREANRVLEEEIKLAARPQVYLLVDCSERVVLIKGRGVELYRLPIIDWRLSGEGPLAVVFRLLVRPPVVRPKAMPGEDPSSDPIDLHDMPADYDLVFDPALILAVAPPLSEQPWLWAKSHLREWWRHVVAWVRVTVTADQAALGAHLRLTLSEEAAQSLAWSVTDGMPMLIRRATSL